MDELVEAFEKTGGENVQVVSGSTGKLFAQIKAGAAFDAFFAADEERPSMLEELGIGIANTKFVYATGRIALCGMGVGDEVESLLREGRFDRLAIANPRLAPYGVAAQEILKDLGILEKAEGKIVTGQNVSQVFQFVVSGAATLGFVSYAQALEIQTNGKSSLRIWLPEAERYTPIYQSAILLSNDPQAIAFFAFCKSDRAARIIESAGYTFPHDR